MEESAMVVAKVLLIKFIDNSENKSVTVSTASSETISLAKALSIGSAYQITVF